MSAAATDASSVHVTSVHISPGKMCAHITVLPHQRTNPQLIERVLQDFPRLPQHSCVNAHGPLFAYVMEDTPLPHLLEHLIIDIQVADQPETSTTTFTGFTEWVNADAGHAAITVSFRDDACALAAVRYACTYLSGILEELSDE